MRAELVNQAVSHPGAGWRRERGSQRRVTSPYLFICRCPENRGGGTQEGRGSPTGLEQREGVMEKPCEGVLQERVHGSPLAKSVVGQQVEGQLGRQSQDGSKSMRSKKGERKVCRRKAGWKRRRLGCGKGDHCRKAFGGSGWAVGPLEEGVAGFLLLNLSPAPISLT